MTKFYIECWPEGQRGEFMRTTPTTELYECPECGSLGLFGHCCGGSDKVWAGNETPAVVVFDHHGELEGKPPACQQALEALERGLEVGEHDEILFPPNMDGDALLAGALLEAYRKYASHSFGDFPGVREALRGLVPEVAKADLGKGRLASPLGRNLRVAVAASQRAGTPFTWAASRPHMCGQDPAVLSGPLDEAWGYAQAIIDHQDREEIPVLLPAYGWESVSPRIAILGRGDAKLVKASEASLLIIPWADAQGKQHYSVSSPNPGGGDLKGPLRRLLEREPGWGGRATPGGILGDPKPQGTTLGLREIIDRVWLGAVDDITGIE